MAANVTQALKPHQQLERMASHWLVVYYLCV
jgi:hypothetical protein